MSSGTSVSFRDRVAEACRAAGRSANDVRVVGVTKYVPAEVARLLHARGCHRIFVEEAGQGIPLLCLHTAGADSRQYRYLLNDAEVTSKYRVIAFDMPYHGRSNPPDGWWLKKYKLTTRDYLAQVRAAGLHGTTVLDALCAAVPIEPAAARAQGPTVPWRRGWRWRRTCPRR